MYTCLKYSNFSFDQPQDPVTSSTDWLVASPALNSQAIRHTLSFVYPFNGSIRSRLVFQSFCLCPPKVIGTPE